MSKFKREDRYIVIKRSDLKNVPAAYRSHLVGPMFSLLHHLPRRECLVIESDWPEYEPTWAAIEARVTGSPLKVAPDVSAMARVLSDRQADACNVDRDDQWKIYGQDFIEDVTAMLAAPSAQQKESGDE